MEPGLDIVGPFVAWHGAAHVGRLRRPDPHEVLVLLGPEGAAEDAVTRARAASAGVIGHRVPGMHALVAVESLVDRVAWAFETVEGIGLVHTVGVEGRALLPTAAAAEVVAQVAEVLLAAGPDARNRGPEPTDLFVTPAGRVVVSGFAGPYPMPPSMRAPRGDEGDSAAVYRLGVLLAHLLGGVAPTSAGEKGAQDAVVRRTLIRIMARPGPALPERYGEWVRAMLAWEASERPPLTTVAEGLRTASEHAEGPSLAVWCAAKVPQMRAQADKTSGNTPVPLSRAPTALALHDEPTDMRRRPPQVGADGTFLDAGARPLDATPVGPPSREDQDETTQEAAAPEMLPSTAVPTRPGPAEMPIRVGPPPEAIKDDVSLPSGFLDQATDEQTAAEVTRWLTPVTMTVWIAVIGLLLSSALLLGAYLLWPSSTPEDDGPQLHDVLPN